MLNNADVVSFLAERFVPLALDNGDNPTWTAAEKQFMSALGGDASTEGMSTFTADGRLLERGGGFDAVVTRKMLGRAAAKFARLSAPPSPPSTNATGAAVIAAPPTGAASLLTPPEGGLVLMVTWKALLAAGAAQGNPAFGDHTHEFERSLGMDRLWVRADEATALVDGHWPASLQQRMQRFVIAPLWPALQDRTSAAPQVPSVQVRAGELLLQSDALKGHGHVQVHEGRVQSFELLLSGPAERVDNFGFPASLSVAPRGLSVPLHVLLEMLDPALPLAQVPPHGARHRDYLK